MIQPTDQTYASALEYYNSGESSRRNFEYDTARDAYLKANEILTYLADEENKELIDLKSKNLNSLGFVEGQLGHYPTAINYLKEALQLRRTLGHPQLEEAYILNNLGLVSEYKLKAQEYNETENSEQRYEVREYYQKARELLREPDSDQELRAEAVILNNLALAKASLDEHIEVHELLEQALEDFERLHDIQGMGQTFHNMGYTKYVSLKDDSVPDNSINFTEKDFNYIKNYYLQALEKRKEIGDKLGEARTLNNLGCLYSEYVKSTENDDDNLLEQASESLKTARKLFEELKHPLGQRMVSNSFRILKSAIKKTIRGGFIKTLLDRGLIRRLFRLIGDIG